MAFIENGGAPRLEAKRAAGVATYFQQWGRT
jgi:hypothetical protein